MKRTCDRCRALVEAQGQPLTCALGYKMDGQKGIPLEECPKPLKIADLLWQLQQQDRDRVASAFKERINQRNKP